MNTDISEFFSPVKNWVLENKPSNPSLTTRFILINDGKIIKNNDATFLFEHLPKWVSQDAESLHIGHLPLANIRMVDVSGKVPEAVELIPLKSLLATSCHQEIAILSACASLHSWNSRYRYCFSCGEVFHMAQEERAKVCFTCHNRCYPHVSPCIIVAVIKNDKILLAQHNRLKKSLYTTLAGFIESGETAEEAVHREVFEEAGIQVKNIKYIGSQAWPFPSQLMLGFICKYKSGTIRLDGHEITDANWFSPDELPEIPEPVSISHYLIMKAISLIAK